MLLALTTAVTLLADPFDTFGTGVVPPVIWNDRNAKAERLRTSPIAPAALLLGSSRIMKLPPRCLTELTGLAAFNFGLSSATAEDMLAAFRFSRAAGLPLRLILVEVAPDELDPRLPPQQRLLNSRYLRRFVAPDRRTSLITQLGVNLLSREALDLSIRSLRHARERAATPAVAVFEADGFLRYRRWEVAESLGTLNRDSLRRVNLADLAAQYRGFERLDTMRIAMLETLFAEAKQARIRVITYRSPPHPAFDSVLAQTPAAARLRDVDSLLAAWQVAGLLEARDPAALGFDRHHAAFFDAIHLEDTSATRLLLTLLGHSSGCALQ
jgi:hypothetical protein